MAQGSRQIQSQAQQQIQTLSPQQILVVKLLELPAVELEDRVHAELLENPALEEGKEESSSDELGESNAADSETEGDSNDYDSLSDYLNEDDIPDYKLQENNRSKGEQAEEIPFSDATSFYEILKEQLRERNLTEHQRELTEYLIGHWTTMVCSANHLKASVTNWRFTPVSMPQKKNWKTPCILFRVSTHPDWVHEIFRNAC